jgi:transglutaminase-like putative cysteine protease
MRLFVDHVTLYTYEEPARQVIQLLRVTPASFTGQTVLDWRVDVDCDARLREGRDGYGNFTHMLFVDRPVRQLRLTVSGNVLTEDQAGVVRGLPADLPPQVFVRTTPLTDPGHAVAALAAEVAGEGGTQLERLHRLNHIIHGRLLFSPGATDSATAAEQALAEGRGVCQDFTHIFIAAARLLGIPARYISGHLFRRDGDPLQEAGHAWAEAWIDDLGWVAFDPTNGISIDDAYVRVACGLDYRDASPIAGARAGGGTEKLDVTVQVREHRSQMQIQAQS